MFNFETFPRAAKIACYATFLSRVTSCVHTFCAYFHPCQRRLMYRD